MIFKVYDIFVDKIKNIAIMLDISDILTALSVALNNCSFFETVFTKNNLLIADVVNDRIINKLMKFMLSIFKLPSVRIVNIVAPALTNPPSADNRINHSGGNNVDKT